MIIKKIENDTRLSADYIQSVIDTASHRYKSYYIDKNKGGKRLIQHPSKELKLLQRWVAKEIIASLPVHDSVYSYREGRGIATLCDRHLKDNYLLRVDFKDFFPSIKGKDVVHLLKNNMGLFTSKLSRNDMRDIRSIVCRFDKLTIGAPSSPAISNAILYKLDIFLYDTSLSMGIKYSRYADDLYFTTNNQGKLSEILEVLKKYLKEHSSPTLLINHDKTIYTSKKRKKVITGIVITSDGKKSIGRKKKKFIKGLVYKYTREELEQKEITYLRGYLSYIKSIEPEFISSLSRKYGDDVISMINNENYIRLKK